MRTCERGRPVRRAGGHSAGVLPWCGGYVLLGRELRGWSGFSGRAEAGESVRETASREFHEETAGAFLGAPLELDDRVCVASSTPSGRQFVLYLERFASVDRAIDERFQAHRRQRRAPSEREKLELAWVHVDDVRALRLSRSFRGDFARVARALGVATARPPLACRPSVSPAAAASTGPRARRAMLVGDIVETGGEVGTVVHLRPDVMRTCGAYVLIREGAPRVVLGREEGARPIPPATLRRIIEYIERAADETGPTGCETV